MKLLNNKERASIKPGKEKIMNTIYNAIFVLVFLVFFYCGCSSNSNPTDAVTGASNIISGSSYAADNTDSKILIILFPSANSSTGKIADAMAEVLNPEIKSPEQIDPGDLHKYDLIGFGSGIFDQKHHIDLLELVDTFPYFPDKKAFIFSTSGVARSSLLKANGEPKFKNPASGDPHTRLRESLLSKGFDIVGEFNCAGFNDNSLLKIFGGMNKGRPNEKDIKLAKDFAGNFSYN